MQENMKEYLIEKEAREKRLDTLVSDPMKYVGIAVSSAIEISQLLLCRGLFEFDDIIHNSLGCMLGCLLGNRMLRLVYGK